MKLEKGKTRHCIEGRWRCFRRNCRASASIFENTIFNAKHLKLSTTIRLIYLFANNYSISEASVHCEISEKSCVVWFKIFRRICVAYQMSVSGFKIGGIGSTVEVDESYVCKRKYNTGRILVKQSIWLVGGICRETNEVFLRFVEKRNSETLTSIIVNSIEPGTTIITDCWRGYLNVERNGYFHYTVNHKYFFVSPENQEVHTQKVERLWRTVKSYIPKNVRREFLESYGSSFLVVRKIGGSGKLLRFNNFVEIIKLFFN
jgi:transposase-like protein